MKTMHRLSVSGVAVAVLIGLAGCAGMSTTERNTAIGAGAGAVGGYLLTDGDALGTIGGAAAGGILGHEWERITD